ncbi:MAG: hypothetical protein HYU35_00530, partial [Parcubacteria group bacterium]|nr:hypothetical protein [Parcubacteria group bacterium]
MVSQRWKVREQQGRSSGTISGTASTTVGLTTVEGTGTRFLTQLGIGDRITLGAGGETRTIVSIASDTSLAVDTPFANATTSVTATQLPSVARFDTSSGSTRFLITDQGRIGIGTTSPFTNFAVVGDTYIDGTLTATNLNATGTISFSGTGTSTFGGPIAHESGDFIVSRGGSGNLLLNPYGGNVGVGTSSPAQFFSVAGNGYVTGGFGVGIATTSSGALETTSNIYGGGTLYITGTSTLAGVSAGYITGSSNLDISRNGTFGGTLTSVGNIGAGTSSPSAALGVQGNALISGDLAVANITATGTLTINGSTLFTDTGTSTFAGGVSAVGADLRFATIFGNFLLGNGAGTTTIFGTGIGVGIATATPASRFSVQGNALISGNLSVAGVTATGTITFSGVATDMLLALNSNGQLVSTSTPTAARYLATSSVASIFPYASTTAITASGTASTTALVVSGLTSGRVPYITTAGLFTDDTDLTFDGSRLTSTYASTTVLSASNSAYFATSGGLVGIGTTSPAQLLSVHGNLYTSGSAFFGGAITATSTLTLSGQGTDMLVALNSLGALVSTSTHTAAYYLATSSTASIFAGGASFGDSNITNVGSIALDSLSSDAGTSITVTLGTDAGDDFIVGNNSALVVEGDTDRVGIGTSSPAQRLSVQGNLYTSGTSFFGGTITATGTVALTPSARTSGVTPYLTLTGAADTGLTAGTEAPDLQFNLARTKTHATGAIALQRDILINAATHASADYGSNITD